MNALLANLQPLPSILVQPSVGGGRRHRIGDHNIDGSRLDRFNELLDRLDHAFAPLDCDRLATAARELCDRAVRAALPAAMPACIGQRMRRIAAAARMVADPAWSAANDAGEAAGVVVAYARDRDDLIPDRLPRVGRLDDAIVIDAAWPRLATEIADYFDFRRLHRLEAALRGTDPAGFRFDRDDWQQARQAEAALAEHRRTIRCSSYLSAPAAVFRVH